MARTGDPNNRPIIANLGTIRLRDAETREILLVPTPSSDPKDPLNWPKRTKLYVAALFSWAIFLCTFATAGPAIAIPEMTITFFASSGPNFLQYVGKTAYFFSVTALMMGVSNLIWIPLTIKYGRRPVYIASFVLFAAMSAWSAVATSYASMLAARTIQGFAAGAGEVLGPLTIADIFFVHERGIMMAIYTFTLSVGSVLGGTIAGFIIKDGSWRVMMWLCCGLTGATAVLMLFTLPETFYARETVASPLPAEIFTKEAEDERIEDVVFTNDRPTGEPPGILDIMRQIPRKPLTAEPYWKLLTRPLALIILPSVLWASLVMSVLIGFLVAVSSNISTAFESAYGFAGWQTGLCMLAGTVGSAFGILFGGHLSDCVADLLTRRNRGVREPEMRLPAMAVSLVTGPVALILYGVGISRQLHWIVPTIGLGLLSFTIVQSSNISVVYMIDCYRPIAGEVTMTQYAFKSVFGFLLSFYTNPWIAKSGYTGAFGEMAAIAGVIFLGMVPMYFFGKALRKASWNWSIVRTAIHWGVDREVGE